MLGWPLAGADTVVLDAPLKGVSLHSLDVDLSVYYLKLDDGAYEVVTTYAAPEKMADAKRFVMAMHDADTARFGLPGHNETLYAFARDGDTLSVSATLIDQDLAPRM